MIHKEINEAFDVMSLCHFFIYFLLGSVIKHNYLLAFVLSILWELFEYFIVKNNFSKNLLRKYWPIPEKYWNETNIYNPISDIIINIFGYYIGSKILTVKIKK